MRSKAIQVKQIDDYIIEIKFDNGEIKRFDVKPYLNHKAFEELKK